MTPEQFKEKMLEISQNDNKDEEVQHEDMDELMCEVLISLGYGAGIEVFYAAPKWYA